MKLSVLIFQGAFAEFLRVLANFHLLMLNIFCCFRFLDERPERSSSCVLFKIWHSIALLEKLTEVQLVEINGGF